MKDGFQIKGDLHLKFTDIVDGSIREYKFPNLVVTAGKALVASRIVGDAPDAIGFMAIGSGSTPPAVGQTALVTQLARVAASSASATGVVATIVANFPAGVGTGTVAEAGLFNESVDGTMLSRATFTAIPKSATDQLEITWTITVS